MTIQRISTYAVHQGTLLDVNRVQTSLIDLQKQISSGFQTDTFEGLSGKVEHFTSLEAKIRKSTTYIEQNQVVLSRLNTMQTNIDRVIELADKMQDLIVLRRNPAAGNSLQFRQQMLSLRTAAVSELNSTFEGRYIFGGTRTNVPPVLDNPFQGPIAPGVPDDNYYQGSKENLIVRADDRYEIEYNIRADDLAFQQLFSAIEQALQGDLGDSDAVLADAQALITTGIESIISTQARVNSNIVALEEVNVRHQDLKLYWTGVKEELINTDLVSASTQVALDQAILQASFQAFARVNELRLADFLR